MVMDPERIFEYMLIVSAVKTHSCGVPLDCKKIQKSFG
jgi:hypothetical protein